MLASILPLQNKEEVISNRNIKWTWSCYSFKCGALSMKKHTCFVTLRNSRAEGQLRQHRGNGMCVKGTFTWVMWNGLPQKSWSASALHLHSLSGWQQGIYHWTTSVLLTPAATAKNRGTLISLHDKFLFANCLLQPHSLPLFCFSPEEQ